MKNKTNGIAKVFDVKEKIACITLDIEKDYDDFINEFNILHTNKKDILKLAKLFKKHKIPISAFIRTDVLIDYPEFIPLLKELAQDFHCHSHTHVTKNFNSKKEIAKTAEIFHKIFKRRAIGYRAPLGVLYDPDIDLLKKHGFLFSSSVFPSYRPRKFNNLKKPITPFVYNNGIIELPFAVVPSLRTTVSLSYLKLFGLNFNKNLFSIFGLPNVIVFDSHLHDYISNEQSFNKLPLFAKIAWGRNRDLGVEFFIDFVHYLKSNGYKFITMTQLYRQVADLKNNKLNE